MSPLRWLFQVFFPVLFTVALFTKAAGLGLWMLNQPSDAAVVGGCATIVTSLVLTYVVIQSIVTRRNQ